MGSFTQTVVPVGTAGIICLEGLLPLGDILYEGLAGKENSGITEASQLVMPQITNVLYFSDWFASLSTASLVELKFSDVSSEGKILYCTSQASGLYMELPAAKVSLTEHSYGYQGVRLISTLGADLPACSIYGVGVIVSGNMGCNSNIAAQGLPAYNYGSVAFTEHEKLLMVQQYTTPIQKEAGDLLTMGWLLQLFSAKSVDV